MRYRIYRVVRGKMFPTTFVSKDKEKLERMLFTLSRAKYGMYVCRNDLEE